MSAVIRKVGKYSVKVVTDSKSLVEEKYISENDAEMDSRAVEAVRTAISKAKFCKKPIAKYDTEKKKAYIEYANGEKKYVN